MAKLNELFLQKVLMAPILSPFSVMLTERLKAKGEGPAEDEKEIEELKGLLPEIKEKIEDSKESQNSARVTELALKATLVSSIIDSVEISKFQNVWQINLCACRMCFTMKSG